MARIRTIKPEIFESLSLKRLSRDARYVFLGLISMADDEGRLVYLAIKVRAHVYGADDDVTNEDVDRCVNELVSAGVIVKYEVENVSYLEFPKWKKHQVINRATPSKLPSYEDSLKARGGLTEGSVNTHGGLTEGSLPEQGTGNREQGRLMRASKRERLTRTPTDFEVSDSTFEWASAKFGFSSAFVKAEAEKFVDWHASKGSKFADWQRAFQNWLRKANEINPPKPEPTAFHFIQDAPLSPSELEVLRLAREARANGVA